jgi:hypothetical protein
MSLNFNLTAINYLFAAHVYVGYRTRNPDSESQQKMMDELAKNNISAYELIAWPQDNCP